MRRSVRSGNRFLTGAALFRGLRTLVPILLTSVTASSAFADRLDEVRARGTLVWGGDEEGGGPYVYPDPANPRRLVGFEVELAEVIAAELGVRAEFHQADWNTLPNFLESGEIDVILNGYEWSPQRASLMLASRPYYIYELQLLVAKRNSQINSWEDLLPRPGAGQAKIGVMQGTAAVGYVRGRLGDAARIIEYDGNTNAMQQVSAGVDDATVQDLPIAVFYRNLPQGSGLRFVGEPVGRGYYVIFAKNGETRLIEAINGAIESAFRDGRLRRIYEKYGLWNPTQDGLLAARPEPRGDVVLRGWDAVAAYGPVLIEAAGTTLLLSFLAMPLAVLLGLLVALGRMYGPAVLRAPLSVYVEVLRGTPLMMQLLFIYFVLPELLKMVGIHGMNRLAAAVIGLGVNYSAYEAEIYRGALQAIPRGQMEAALALGMTRRKALRLVIVPQALRIALPAVTNDFIALFKDTSICSAIAVIELTKQYNILSNSTGARLELAAMTAGLYLAMSYPLSVMVRRLERQLGGEREK
ncbi:MAG TPA: ABC transporter permease subunit [Phycisphaerae bacterium]|nr:ABC transporter permease subunit [Phycisphaerae bacterium]